MDSSSHPQKRAFHPKKRIEQIQIFPGWIQPKQERKQRLDFTTPERRTIQFWMTPTLTLFHKGDTFRCRRWHHKHLASHSTACTCVKTLPTERHVGLLFTTRKAKCSILGRSLFVGSRHCITLWGLETSWKGMPEKSVHEHEHLSCTGFCRFQTDSSGAVCTQKRDVVVIVRSLLP